MDHLHNSSRVGSAEEESGIRTEEVWKNPHVATFIRSKACLLFFLLFYVVYELVQIPVECEIAQHCRQQ